MFKSELALLTIFLFLVALTFFAFLGVEIHHLVHHLGHSLSVSFTSTN